MDKIYKYIKKYNKIQKNIYLKKIAYYLTGGNIRKYNLDSFQDLLRNKLGDSRMVTQNKFIIILMGPPASGKTDAVKIAYEIIKNNYTREEKRILDNIDKTFINTGVDDLVYDIFVDETDETIKLQLSRKGVVLEQCLNDAKTDTERRECLSRLENDNGLYFGNRPYGDALSEILMNFSLAFGKNIIFESASPYSDYIKNLISNASRYNYIPIVIYPVVTPIKTLQDRSINRAKIEGRLPACTFINSRRAQIISSVPDLIKYLETEFIYNKNKKDAMYILYDGNDYDIDQHNMYITDDERRILTNLATSSQPEKEKNEITNKIKRDILIRKVVVNDPSVIINMNINGNRHPTESDTMYPDTEINMADEGPILKKINDMREDRTRCI
jgi:hypothetical protein